MTQFTNNTFSNAQFFNNKVNMIFPRQFAINSDPQIFDNISRHNGRVTGVDTKLNLRFASFGIE